MRPRSIMLFEILSLAAVAVFALTLAMSWHSVMAKVHASIRGAGIEPAVMVLAALYVGLLVLLIFLTSRRGSAAAKWLFTILVLVTLATSVPGLLSMTRGGIVGWTQILQLILQAAGLWFLFVPASRTWLREWRAA
jgi:hypothetical protein